MANNWTPEQQGLINKKFTLKGRILHPNLLKVKRKAKPEDRDIFDVQFVWNPMDPANGAMTGEIFQWVQQASNVFHAGFNPQAPAFVFPIKASKVQGLPEYQRQDGRPNQEYLAGHCWVNASTGKDFPPQVVKQVAGVGLVRLTEQDAAEVYSGRNACITISFYPILPKAGSASQKRGFSVNVDAVLLQEGGEVIAGSATVDVNQAFAGFVQDMGAAPAFGQFGQTAAPAPQAQPQQSAPAPQWGAPAPGQQAAPQPAWGAPAPAAQPQPAAQPAWGAQPQQQQQQQQWGNQPQTQAAPANGTQQPPWMPR
jgi:hypothetical protein